MKGLTEVIIRRSSSRRAKLLAVTLLMAVFVGALTGGSSSVGALVPNATKFFPPQSGYLAVSADSSTDAWAVGGYMNPNVGTVPLAGHWDGKRWVNSPVPPQPHSNDSELTAVSALSSTDVWGVGTYSYPTETGQPFAEHWNGKAWSIDDPAIPTGSEAVDLQAVDVVSSSSVWVNGDYEGPNFTEYTLVEHWNGHLWKITKTLDPSKKYDQNELHGSIALSDSDVWAVGTVDLQADGYVTLVEHWDGKNWTRIPSADVPDEYNQVLNGVSADSASDIWAVGNCETESDAERPLIERWNGTSWTEMTNPLPPGAVSAELSSVSAVSPKDVWASGYYQTGNFAPAYLPFIVHYNGVGWTQSPSPLPPKSTWTDIEGIAASSHNEAFVVGEFSFNHKQSGFVEQWNGHKWAVTEPAEAPPMPLASGDASRPGYAPTDTCFSQLSGTKSGEVVSQKFPDYTPYDSEAADNFTLRKSCKVKHVDVLGKYFSSFGPAASVGITIYQDKAGKPGEVVSGGNQPADRYTDPSGRGNLQVVLKHVVDLKPGKYWISVVVNMAYRAGGEWGWVTLNPQSGPTALWRNPPGGFSMGCQTFTNLIRCFGFQIGHNLAFAITT